MDILWHPEKGRCACCGRACESVRQFSSGGSCLTYCWGCWTSAEECLHLTVLDWVEDEALVLMYPEDEAGKTGTAQEALAN